MIHDSQNPTKPVNRQTVKTVLNPMHARQISKARAKNWGSRNDEPSVRTPHVTKMRSTHKPAHKHRDRTISIDSRLNFGLYLYSSRFRYKKYIRYNKRCCTRVCLLSQYIAHKCNIFSTNGWGSLQHTRAIDVVNTRQGAIPRTTERGLSYMHDSSQVQPAHSQINRSAHRLMVSVALFSSPLTAALHTRRGSQQLQENVN